MAFPQTKRVIYAKNPLRQVICQFRFPTILRIDSQEPADFQDRIRKDFPLYRTAEPPIPSQVLQILPVELRGAMPGVERNHEFLNGEETLKINLTKDFIALTALSYDRWENYYKTFKKIFDAFTDIYQPAYFTRIGLRYINEVRKKLLNLEDVAWTELLNEHIVGELSFEPISESIVERQSTILMWVESLNCFIRVNHGLTRKENDKVGEPVYSIDNDLFTEKRVEVGDGPEILRAFNNKNRDLFRWCITSRLHNALEPKDID